MARRPIRRDFSRQPPHRSYVRHRHQLFSLRPPQYRLSFFQLVIHRQIGGAKAVEQRRVRFVPHAAIGRFEEAFGDVAQRPGVAATEEVLHGWVEGVLLGQVGVHPVLDHVGGGVVAEEVIDRGGHLQRALIAVARDRRQPLRVDDSGAEDALRFFCQVADPGAGRIGAVAEVGARPLAGQ